MPRAALIGQPSARRWFSEARREGRLSHALLLYGPVGVGRKSFARWAARELLCLGPGGEACACDSCRALDQDLHPDLHCLRPDPGKRALGIGKVRDLIDVLGEAAKGVRGRGTAKVALVETAHTLTTEAANAFLKTLEEPPEETYLFLVAERRSQVLSTIRSRSCPLRLERLTAGEVEGALRAGGVEAERARKLAESCGGSLGLAREMADEQGLEPLAPGLLFDPQVAAPTAALRLADALKVRVEAQRDAIGGGVLAWRRRLLRAHFADVARLLRDAQVLRAGARVSLLMPRQEELSARLGGLPSRQLEAGFAALDKAREGLDRNLNIELLLAQLACDLPRP